MTTHYHLPFYIKFCCWMNNLKEWQKKESWMKTLLHFVLNIAKFTVKKMRVWTKLIIFFYKCTKVHLVYCIGSKGHFTVSNLSDTSHQSPVNSYQSTITSHQSPVTSYQYFRHATLQRAKIKVLSWKIFFHPNRH